MNKKKESKVVPNVRFKGFTDVWKQRKLGDVSEIIGGGTPSTNHPEYWDGDIDWYSPAEILDQIYVKRSRRRITQLGYDNSSAKLLPPGTVLFTSRAGIGKTAILSQKSCTNQGFQSIVPHENELDTYFIFSRTNELKRYGELVGAGSTFTEVSGKQMSAMNLMLPTTIQEQQLIGQFFKKLDCLITLHQQKITLLIKLKKAMLEKMFPKKGTVIPEFRFNGFANAWEQRKFSQGVSEIGDGLHGTPTYCDNGNVFFINGNNLVDGKIVINSETKTVDETQQSLSDKDLDDNTILLSINGTIGNLAYYSGEKLMLGKSAAYIKVSAFDIKFVYTYLQTPSVHSYFMNSLTGTTIKNLGLKAIREMKLDIPQDIDEQKKIGDYFSTLDNLITLHQRKIDKIKNMKKVMLDQMFI